MLTDFFSFFGSPIGYPALKECYGNYLRRKVTSCWVEDKDKWVLVVNNNDADITIDEDTITIKYEVSSRNNEWYEYQKTVSFPENSNHETIKAKREDGKIFVTVDKVVLEEKKTKKLIIE